MDSVVEDDITLPLDFDRSTNLAKFKEAVAATTGGDMLDSSSEFSEGLAVRPRTTAAASQDDPISPPTKTMRDYEYVTEAKGHTTSDDFKNFTDLNKKKCFGPKPSSVTQISELKKENFGLKLRIYFLEERMNQALQDTPQDVFTANVELKVTVEKLKKELVEKQELLVKASNAVEAMAQHSELQVKQLTEEHNEELQEIREGYENKLKEIEKELTVARRDFEDVADKLTETVNLNHQLNEKLMENTEGFHEDQRQLEVAAKATLDEKDQMIDDLRDENETLKDHVKELRELLDNQEQDGHQKKAVDANKDKIEECEKEIKQLTEQLNSRQRKVEELMEQTKKVERANKNLRNQLHDREVELKSRNPMNTSLSQNQKDGSGSKDSEVQKLNTKIQDLEQSLTATRESAHSAKRKWYQANEEHEELLRARDSIIAALQSSLSAKDLEMEKMIRSISAKEVEFQRVNNGKLLLEQRFDEMLKQKDRELAELMEKLKSLSQEHCSKMDALEEACQQVSAGAQEQLEKKDKIIQKLAENNKEKDAFLGDLLDALKEAGSLDNSGVKNHPESQDSFVKNLRKHLKDKDSAVEVAIEEKQRAEQDKEAELQQLRQALRERDRLIEKINSAVLESEERKKLLESSCKEKDEALQRLAASLEDEQKTQKETFESTAASLKEKEAVIQTLNNNLTNRDRELKELKDFVKNALNTPGEEEVSDDETKKAQELSDLLKQKEKLLEDMFQERSRMSSAHEASSQRLIGVLRDKEAAVKEVSNDLTRVQTEKNATIQRLQQLLNSKDHELQALENSKTWASQEHDKLLNKLQMIIQDKDKTIESLVESVREKDKMLHKLNAELRRTIDQLQAEIQEKDESSKKLELEYKANLTRLQENEGEKNMKLQSLAHEMQTRDALLKQAQGTIENLRARLQSMPKIEELQQKFAEQTMALAEAQKSKEQAFVDSAALQKSNLALEAELKSKLNSMDMLTESAQMKDNIIQEMQEDQQRQIKDMKENITYYRNKAQELETSNNQLRQSLMQVEDAKNGLENQLESYKRRLSSRATYSEEEVNLLRQEVTNLKARLQRPGTPRRESPCVGAGAEEQKPDVLQLQQMLDAQISETKRLHNILATERALYGELATVVQETMQGTRSEWKVQEEMQTLKSLRAQLDEGIRQNETLRGELRDKLAFTNTRSSHPLSPYDVAYQREIQELKSKLEDSERWNASLQARLNESRVSGVGGSSAIRDSGDGVTAGAASPTKVQWLQQQLEILKNQLQQSIQFNSRLKNQLDEVNSLNVQTIADKDHVIQDLTRQIEHLQSQLDKTRETFGDVEARLADANAKLECYASNLNGSYEETLLEREQELETLKLQLEELRRNQTDKRIITDIGAQTSPAKDWDYLPSGEVRELEQRLKESRTANERYKQMLEEKVNELKWLKHKNAAKAKDEKDAKMREMAEIEHLRKEYKAGIVTNEELRRHLESERDKSTTSDNVSELHLKLDESLQRSDILEQQLDEISRSEGEVNRLRRELQIASQLNDSLGTRIRELNESMSRMKETGNEVARLQKERNDARRLNKTLSDQLKETRKSAEEVGRVQLELREAKTINGQLGKQLADLLNHSAQMKGQLEKLQHELQEREKVVETLQLRLQSKAQMQSRALSPFSPMSASSPSPTKRFVDVQTSPVFNLASPPQVTRVVIPTGSPQNETLSEATEKMHQLNRMLLGENQLLRSKLKDSERLNATLKEENNMFSKLHSQSTQTQDAQLKRSAPEDLLATYMAEMRELRMRLEDSIRTNDALRAQLEKRLSEGTGEGKSEEGPEKIVLIRENDSLRTELLEKDRTNEKLKRTVDELRHQRTRDKEQINLLRQQFVESSKALENLKQELAVYEKLYNLSADGKATEVQTDGPSYGKEGPRSPTRELENNAVALLLAEIRSLRVQLEKSIQTNNALRLKLEEQLSRPMASPSQSPRRSQTTVVRQLNFPEGRRGEKFDSAQGAGSDAAGGQDVVDQLKDKLTVINQVATIAYHRLKSNAETNTILSQIENILRIVLECNALLETFHADASSQRASGNSVDTDGQNKSLKLEIAKLRRRLLVQEDIIKRACERLEETKEAKERMRSEIVQQLSLTQNVMSSARCKLEDRGQKDE